MGPQSGKAGTVRKKKESGESGTIRGKSGRRIAKQWRGGTSGDLLLGKQQRGAGSGTGTESDPEKYKPS